MKNTDGDLFEIMRALDTISHYLDMGYHIKVYDSAEKKLKELNPFHKSFSIARPK